MKDRILELVAGQAPANFAMVMATGIVSLALAQLGMAGTASLLLWLNMALLAGLLLGLGLRLALFPRRALGDAAHPLRGPGYFTLPAALCVMGRQCFLLAHWPQAARFLFWAGALFWAAAIWGVFFALITAPKDAPRQDAPPPIHGAWLVAVVSSQALVVLGCNVFSGAEAGGGLAVFLLIALFGTGFALYGMLITIILYRLAFFPLEARDLNPTFWINAGAMAITTLAGCELARLTGQSPSLSALAPFLKGLTITAWGLSTWWFGLLVPLGVWRHVIRRVPFRYGPEYWGLVFPLGMYTACTLALSDLTGVTALRGLPPLTATAAAIAWTATFYGLCAFLCRHMAGTRNHASQAPSVGK